MKPTITTHDHAPAPYHALDTLALLRAVQQDEKDDELDSPVQSWRDGQMNELRSDNEKLQEQLIRAEKQADLGRAAAEMEKSNLEYLLHKAEAERTAAVLLLVMFVAVTLGVLV